MSEQRISILVIDDDPELTLTLGAILEAEGYDVLLSNSGERGLELAYTRRPHLVLLDVAMPVMDGYAVCRELQFGYTKDIPVVFLTAKTGLADMMEANRSGASAYVTKPFRTQHLLQTVRDVLRDASAYYDEITGLPTLAHVQLEVQRTMDEHSHLGILYVTVDSVQALEQSQGFEVVDEMYRAIGRRLHEARGHIIRNQDFVSVSSLGNGFLVILSPARGKGFVGDDDLEVVRLRLKERLLGDIEQDLEASLLAQVDLRVGCARLTQSPKVRFKRALMAAIDEATHGIERERDEVRHRLSLEFGRVVDAEEISCVYQPIVGLHGFGVFGYELLARGPRQSELYRPDALFEVARAEARVPELDRICRMMAARAAATLPPNCLRFINAEPLNLFFHPDSDIFVREFVEATPAALRAQTVVEITENAVIDDFAHMREVVRRLRGSGFRIAIDDAGAGYAGLQTMVEIEPDFIKLDMSLTRGIESSIVKQKLVGTLRDFCRQAFITLVAEGIETRAQLDALVALGIDYGQGFLFAHPGSPHPEITVCPPVDTARPAASIAPADPADPARVPGANATPGRT